MKNLMQPLWPFLNSQILDNFLGFMAPHWLAYCPGGVQVTPPWRLTNVRGGLPLRLQAQITPDDRVSRNINADPTGAKVPSHVEPAGLVSGG